MRGSTMHATVDDGDFEAQLEKALKAPSDDAARAMLARGRYISYREKDTPPGHVIREYPDGTRVTVRIELPTAA